MAKTNVPMVDYIEVRVQTEEETFIGYSGVPCPLKEGQQFLTLGVARDGFSTFNIKVSDIKYFIVNVVMKEGRAGSDIGRTLH